MNKLVIKALYIKIPVDIHAEAKMIAIKKGITLSTYVRRAIVESLKKDKQRGL